MRKNTLKLVPSKEIPDEQVDAQSDSTGQSMVEHETQESFSISKNIAWLLLILIGIIIVISYMIKIRKSG